MRVDAFSQATSGLPRQPLIGRSSIGETTVKLINEFAKKNNLTLEKSAITLIQENKIKPKTKLGLNSLLNLLNKWRNDLLNKKIGHIKLMQIILDESGYSYIFRPGLGR